MSCIPFSGGCERPATDALVRHLNMVEESRFEHSACLDQTDSTRSQPECLYVDPGSDRRLVIERKSIMWPEMYAYEHSKDHALADLISDGLRSLEFKDLYVLKMPALKGVTKQQLELLGRSVAQEIKVKYAALKPGQLLRITTNGYVFRFGTQPIWERDDFGPSARLCFSWTRNDGWPQETDLQEELRPQVLKIFEACTKKFAGYLNDRRLLMLDPHGDISFRSPRWWNSLFKVLQPPPAIGEIWIGSSGDDGFGEEEWVIEKVFGGNVSFSEPIPVTIET